MAARRRAKCEGGIWQRKDGTWAGQVNLPWAAGRRPRKTVYGATREAVAAKLRAVQEKVDKGLPIPNEQLTVRAWLEHWLTAVAPDLVKVRTLHGYDQLLRQHVIPFLGSVRLARLQPAQVQRWLKDRHEAGVTASRRRAAHTVLRIALNEALRLELVSRNVATLVRPPRVTPRDVEPLSLQQAQLLLAALRGHQHEALILLGLALGLREGEVLGLRWADFEVTEGQEAELPFGQLRVRRQVQRVRYPDAMLPAPAAGQRLRKSRLEVVELKTKRARRTLAIPPTLVQLLEHQRRRCADLRRAAGERWKGPEPGFIFPSRLGTPIEPRNLVRAWYAIRAAAGLDAVRFHDLRHSASTLMLALNVDPRTVMGILGHTQIATTMNIYGHVVDANKRAAAQAVEDRLLTRKPPKPKPPSEPPVGGAVH